MAGGPGRIVDVSTGGCFVETRAAVSEGNPGSVTLELDEVGPLTLPGTIVTVEPGMGFAMRFDDLPEAAAARLERYVVDNLPVST